VIGRGRYGGNPVDYLDGTVDQVHLYDRALLNGAALRAVGYTRDTPAPPGGEIVRDSAGNPTGLLLAKPNASILYATLAKGPKLPFDYQLNSTRHFMRELNRLGVTGAIDAGGGFQNFPEDYQVIQQLADAGQLTIRLAYNLFTQKAKEEQQDFLKWTASVTYNDSPTVTYTPLQGERFARSIMGSIPPQSVMNVLQAGFPVEREWFKVRADNPIAYWQLVRAGAGIGFGQVLVGARDPELVEIPLGLDLPTYPVWLTAHEAVRHAPRVARVWELLAEELRATLAR